MRTVHRFLCRTCGRCAAATLIGDDGGVSSQTERQAERAAEPEHLTEKRRGRENAADMVRSLGLVMVLVIGLWWLAQPGEQDEREIRVIDNSGSVAALLREAPGTPVPSTPAQWQPTVADGVVGGLRLGYVTPSEHYVEFVVSTGGDPEFLETITGKGTQVGTFDIGEVTWQQYSGEDRATSLVRVVGEATVVVGGLRETATFDELATLAQTVTR